MDAPGNDGNASIPEQVKRPNPWRKMMMMMMMIMIMKMMMMIMMICCIRSFLVELFLRIAGVSYGRFMAMRCKLICQRIFSTVGDR